MGWLECVQEKRYVALSGLSGSLQAEDSEDAQVGKQACFVKGSGTSERRLRAMVAKLKETGSTDCTVQYSIECSLRKVKTLSMTRK